MSHCPDLSRLRALAEEDERDETLLLHVKSCARCTRLVDLARREERAIRGALPVEPPRDLLEKTLRALDAEAPRAKRPDSGRRRARSLERPRPIFALLLAAAVVLAALCLGYQLVVSEPAPPPEEATAPPDATKPPKPTETPAAPPKEEKPEPPAPPTTPDENPKEPGVSEPPAETHPKEKPPVGEKPVPPENPPPPAEKPPETPPTQTKPDNPAPALAIAKAGKLGAPGKPLAVGDSLPAGTVLEAASQAEIESAGRAKLVLAARTKIVVREGERGEVVFQISQGKAFVRTAGEKPYALSSDDVRATPLGTAFVFAVESGRTRVSTIDGKVRCQVERSTFSLDVRAGYEADLSRGKAPEAARPLEATKALAWLAAGSRPAKLPPLPQLVRSFSFEEGLDGWTKGERKESGARGSQGCLHATPGASDYAVSVELEQMSGVFTIDSDFWIEAVVKVDRKTVVVLQVWDVDRKENLAFMQTVEPGRWTTVAAPLRDFGDSRGKPREKAVGAGDRATCFTVFAGKSGEKVELLVDDVRFSLEKNEK